MIEEESKRVLRVEVHIAKCEQREGDGFFDAVQRVSTARAQDGRSSTPAGVLADHI
jgi:hypothetical protein